MQVESITRVEKNVDQAAAVLFGVASGYSAFLFLGAAARLGPSVIAALAAAVALVAYVLAFKVLSAVPSEARKLPVREFRLREVEPLGPDDEFEEFEPAAFVPLHPRGAQALLAAPSVAEPQELLLTEAIELVAEVEHDELLLTESYPPEGSVEPSVEPELELNQPEEAPEFQLMEVFDTEDPFEEEPLSMEDGPVLNSDSRVVRLFDAAAMRTPGELGSQIERHLEREPAAAVQSAEAAQALQDALAELRRSIPNRR